MLEEVVTVTACEADHAEVRIERQSACGDCAAASGCGTKALSGIIGNRRLVVRALNPIGARPGERVVIGVRESAMTRMSLAAYLAPLAAFFVLAALGQAIGLRLTVASAETFSIAGGLSGLLLGLGWLRHFSARHTRDARYQAVILRHAGTQGRG